MTDQTAESVHICLICGWTYSEKEGHPETGIPPGTAWPSVPDHWTCPECGVEKDDFSQIWL